MRWFIALVLGLLLVGALFVGYREKPQDPLVEIRGRLIACLESGERSWRGGCFRELATWIADRYSFEETLRMFAILDDESPVKETCHALMHYVGQDAYAATGDLPGTFAKCSQQIACGEGCFHGAVEGYMIETGDTDAAGLPKLCDRSFTGSQINHDACTHGIGHALMLTSSGAVPESLDVCSTLSDERSRRYCYAGVFMENVFGYGSRFHPSRFLDPARPEFPCTILATEYGDACYESQSSYVLNYLGGPQAAAAFCATVPEAHAAACFGNIGGDVVVTMADPSDVREACALAPEGDARIECYRQALLFRLHMTSGDVMALRAICDASEEGIRSECDGMAGVLFEEWYPDAREARCDVAYADDPARRVTCSR